MMRIVLLLMLLLCEAKLMKVAVAMTAMAAFFYWPKEIHMQSIGNHPNASHNMIAIIVAAELRAAAADARLCTLANCNRRAVRALPC
jgi:hypothetical protein